MANAPPKQAAVVLCAHVDPIIVYAAEIRAPWAVRCRIMGRQQSRSSREADLGGKGVTFVISAFVNSLEAYKRQVMDGHLQDSIKKMMAKPVAHAVKKTEYGVLLEHLQTTYGTCQGCRSYCDIVRATQWRLDMDGTVLSADVAATTGAHSINQQRHAVVILQHAYTGLCVVGVTLGNNMDLLALALGRLGAVPFPGSPTKAHWALHEKVTKSRLSRLTAVIETGVTQRSDSVMSLRREVDELASSLSKLETDKRSLGKLGWSTVYRDDRATSRPSAMSTAESIHRLWYEEGVVYDSEASADEVSRDGFDSAGGGGCNMRAMTDMQYLLRKLKTMGLDGTFNPALVGYADGGAAASVPPSPARSTRPSSTVDMTVIQ